MNIKLLLCWVGMNLFCIREAHDLSGRVEVECFDWLCPTQSHVQILALSCDGVGVGLIWVLLSGISVLKQYKQYKQNKQTTTKKLLWTLLLFLLGADTVRRNFELGSEPRCQVCWWIDVGLYCLPELWEMNGYCLSHSSLWYFCFSRPNRQIG